MSKATIVGGVVGGGAVIGSLAYFFTRTKKPTVSSIQLNGNPTSIGVNGSVTWVAFAYDSNNKPVANIPISLVDQTTQTTINMGNTDSSGSVSTETTFTQSGTYVLAAEYNTIKSSTVTITVTVVTPTTCTCCQKYSESLGQCVDLVASNISLSLVSSPADLFLHMWDSYDTKSGGWYWTDSSGQSIGTEVLVPIDMLITDSDGNTVCATGSCSDAYTVYGSLSESYTHYTIPAPGAFGDTGHFNFDLHYYVTDSQGNRFNTYKGNSNGEATAYIMLSVENFGFDAIALTAGTQYATITPEVTFYAGFKSGSTANAIPVSFNIKVTMKQTGLL